MDDLSEIIDYPDDVEILNDIDTMKSGSSYSGLVYSLLENSSIPSLSRIGHSKTTNKRIFWTLIFIASLCGGCYETYSFLRIYLQYPVLVDIGFAQDNNLDFPAVTICNLNNVKSYHSQCVFQNVPFHKCQSAKSRTRLINTLRKKYINWWKQLNKANLQNTQNFVKHYINLDSESRKRYGYSYGDIVEKCTFKSKVCNESNFTHYLSIQFGNCFTFKTELDSDNLSEDFRDDSLDGLELELNVQEKDYVPFTAETGFRIEIHDPEVDPNPEENGFNISPGFETHVRMLRNTYYRLPAPYRDRCRDYFSENSNSRVNSRTDYLKYRTEEYTVYSNATGTIHPFFVKSNTSQIDCLWKNFKIPNQTKHFMHVFNNTRNKKVPLICSNINNLTEFSRYNHRIVCNMEHHKENNETSHHVEYLKKFNTTIEQGMFDSENDDKIKLTEARALNYEDLSQEQYTLNNERASSQTDCIRKCLLKHTLKTCLCVDPFLPHNSFPPCDLKNETEMICLDDTMDNLEKNGLPCDCPLPCFSTSYNQKVFSSRLHSSSSWRQFSQINFNGDQDDDESLVNFPEKKQRVRGRKAYDDDKVKLQVFFQSLDHTVYRQRAMFSESELFSHIGGSLSLWLGLSLVSLVECVENVYRLIQVCKLQLRKKLKRVNYAV